MFGMFGYTTIGGSRGDMNTAPLGGREPLGNTVTCNCLMGQAYINYNGDCICSPDTQQIDPETGQPITWQPPAGYYMYPHKFQPEYLYNDNGPRAPRDPICPQGSTWDRNLRACVGIASGGGTNPAVTTSAVSGIQQFVKDNPLVSLGIAGAIAYFVFGKKNA